MQQAATTPGGRLAQPRQAAARPQFAAGNQVATSRSAGSSAPRRRAMAERQQAVTCQAAASQADAPTKVVDTGLPRTAVVGVLGGGQLGKMMAQEAVSGQAAAAALAPCASLLANASTQLCLLH